MLYVFGLLAFGWALMVVAVVVYPFRYAQYAVRVLKQTAREFDDDGYRMLPNESGEGYHYMRNFVPIYPLDGYSWSQRVGRFSSDPVWCVTCNIGGTDFWFCKRNGERFKLLPAPLQGRGPREAFKEHARAAAVRWRDAALVR